MIFSVKILVFMSLGAMFDSLTSIYNLYRRANKKNIGLQNISLDNFLIFAWVAFDNFIVLLIFFMATYAYVCNKKKKKK